MTAPAEDPRSGETKHAGIVREATDLCWKATPFNEDTTGAITDYLLPAGVVHRLLGQLQGAGYPAAFRAIAAPPAAGRGDTDSGGDDLDRYIAEQQRDPQFRAAFAAAQARPAGDRAQPTQELREAIKDTLRLYGIRGEKLGSLRPGAVADALLALPAVAALLDAQAAVNRMEALVEDGGHEGWVSTRAVRRALDGTT